MIEVSNARATPRSRATDSHFQCVEHYLPSHGIATYCGWNTADCVARSYDIEGMHFGTIGAGPIGLAVLRRLKPFDFHLHYSDPHWLSPEIEKELSLIFHPDADLLVRAVDIIEVHMPLYPSTEHFFDDAVFAKMKRGTYLVNTARGKLIERDAVVRASFSSSSAATTPSPPGRRLWRAAGSPTPRSSRSRPRGPTSGGCRYRRAGEDAIGL